MGIRYVICAHARGVTTCSRDSALGSRTNLHNQQDSGRHGLLVSNTKYRPT